MTADWELNPLDEGGLRAAIIEGCRRRGIFAMDAGSLAVSALLLDSPRREAWCAHEEEFQRWVDLAVQIGAQQQRSDTREDDDEADLDSSGERASQSQQQAPEVISNASGESADSRGAGGDTAPRRDSELVCRSRCRRASGAPIVSRRRSPHGRLSRQSSRDGGRDLAVRARRSARPDDGRDGRVRRDDVPDRRNARHRRERQAALPRSHKEPRSRRADLERTAALASTNALGWKVDGVADNPFGVDYRGMHEGRAR